MLHLQREEEEARRSTQFRARPYDPARYSAPPLLTPEGSRAFTNGGSAAPRGAHRRDALEGRFTPAATRQERQNAARAAREVCCVAHLSVSTQHEYRCPRTALTSLLSGEFGHSSC